MVNSLLLSIFFFKFISSLEIFLIESINKDELMKGDWLPYEFFHSPVFLKPCGGCRRGTDAVWPSLQRLSFGIPVLFVWCYLIFRLWIHGKALAPCFLCARYYQQSFSLKLPRSVMVCISCMLFDISIYELEKLIRFPCFKPSLLFPLSPACGGTLCASFVGFFLLPQPPFFSHSLFGSTIWH